MNDAPPAVTVIIVARNRPDELATTLRELRHQDFPSFDVMIVDDASEPSLAPVAAREWPEARYVRHATRQGLIACRSQAMREARGALVAILDDDAHFVDPGGIAMAVKEFEADPRLGILACGVMETHRGRPIVRPVADRRYLNRYKGAGHVIRRQILDELGTYEDWFMYGGEELDLSLRAWDAGWRVLAVPEVRVRHRLSAIGRSASKIHFYNMRSLLWVVMLRYPLGSLLTDFPLEAAIAFREAARGRHPVSWFFGLVASLARLPTVLRRRRAIRPETMRRVNVLRYFQVTDLDQLERIEAPGALARFRMRLTRSTKEAA